MNIIIGGSISGLYIANQLHKQGSKFLILEKNGTVRGRLVSETYKGVTFEHGMSVMTNMHTKILGLIEEYGMKDKLIKLDNPKTLYHSTYFGLLDPEKYKSLYGRMEKLKGGYLKKNAKKIFGIEDYYLFKTMTSDWYEVEYVRSEYFFNDNPSELYLLGGGISKLLSVLTEKFEQNIEYNNGVLEIVREHDDSFLVRTNTNTYACYNVYLCTDVTGARNIKYTNISAICNVIEAVAPIPCMRVYMYFKEKTKWLGKYNHVVTDALFKWLIKISDNLLMVSYTDGSRAYILSLLHNEGKLTKKILKTINKIFGVNLGEEDVEKVWVSYWKEGVPLIYPDISVEHLYDMIKKLPSGFVQTVAPMNYDKYQCWAENHLFDLDTNARKRHRDIKMVGGGYINTYDVGEKDPKIMYDEHFKMSIMENDSVIQSYLKKGYLFGKDVIISIFSLCVENDTILDIGANIGCITIPCTKKFKVHAFEPFKENFGILMRNIEQNKLNIKPVAYNVAVGHKNMTTFMGESIVDIDRSKKTTLKKIDSDTDINYGAVQLGSKGQPIEMITLDSLMGEIKKISLIKVDVEGAEPLVFYGAQKIIKRDMPIILFEKNFQKLTADTINKLGLSGKPEIYDFDIVKYCWKIGYTDIMHLRLEDYVILPPGWKERMHSDDNKFVFSDGDAYHFTKNKINTFGMKLYKLHKIAW